MEKIDLILQGTFTDYTYEVANYYLQLPFVNKIVISCWENDVMSRPFSERFIIVKSKDVENPGLGNRNRQIKSSLEGLKLSTTTFSVKLRTDQKMTLNGMQEMYNFYFKHKEQNIYFTNGNKPNNQICVGSVFRKYPFHPKDHWYWGNTQDLIDVFNIPLDTFSLDPNFSKYVRTEAYIASWYYAKFDNEILKYINEPAKYLVDGAPNITEALAKSAYWEAKIFKPFPRINFIWDKYGINNNYNFNYMKAETGEYWDGE